MVVSISQFRQDLFSLVESAAKGEVVEFIHNGAKFRVVPEAPVSKLDQIKPLNIVRAGDDVETGMRELAAEMRSEWEKDWAEI